MAKNIDWKKCVLCQKHKDDVLKCPAKSKRSDVGSGYKTLALHLRQVFELDSKLLPFDFEVLNDGDGVAECLMSNNVCWHNS